MTKTKETPLKQETATEAFRKQIGELKPRLPKDWKLRFIKEHPEYDSYQGGILLHLVINQRSTDTVVLEGIKKIVTDYEKEIKK